MSTVAQRFKYINKGKQPASRYKIIGQKVKQMSNYCKEFESPITQNHEQEKDFYEFPVVKMYGADLFQRDVTETESGDETQE